MHLCEKPTKYKTVFGRQMIPVLQVFQVDHCKHSFGHTRLT